MKAFESVQRSDAPISCVVPRGGVTAIGKECSAFGSFPRSYVPTSDSVPISRIPIFGNVPITLVPSLPVVPVVCPIDPEPVNDARLSLIKHASNGGEYSVL